MNKNLKKVQSALMKKGFQNVTASLWRQSVCLTGEVDIWEHKIEAGTLSSHKGFKAVINDIKVKDVIEEEISIPNVKDDLLENKEFDAAIIGGGVIGCAVARELSKYNISVVLLEKEEDLAKHASGRNDGMIHDGFAAKPGTLKAHYNVRGNRLYDDLCKELEVDFKRPGNLILFSSPFTKLALPIFNSRSKKNDVDGYEYLSKKEVARREPNLTDKQYGAYFLPSAGVLSPYKLTIALAENAAANGVEVALNTVVTGFEIDSQSIKKIKTNRGTFKAKAVINAAGIWADYIAELADDRFFTLYGRKGVDAILDIKTGKYQTHSAAMPPLTQTNSKTKGGGLVITPEGNILVGPNARDTSKREDYSTKSSDIEDLQHHIDLNTKVNKSDIITYFAGIRACAYDEDFIIEPSDHIDNLIYAAGIQSPGFASAPAIAEDIRDMVIEKLSHKMAVLPDENFNPIRKSIPDCKNMPFNIRADLIKKNPSYGRIVCRCEEISEGEIRDALRSPIPVTTVDGLKRRIRVTAGRCHGGFCTPRVLEIMTEELQSDITSLTKKGTGSEMIYGNTKSNVNYDNASIKSMAGEVK
jgi:glycerol-3-phosphate dehydrogenase